MQKLAPGDLRSGHQVRSSDPTSKKVWACTKARADERSIWHYQELVRVTVCTKRISRNFDICDLRSGQFYDLPIISQWEKFQLALNVIQWSQYAQDHDITGPFWWFNRKKITCDLWKVLPRSSEVTNGFSAITFDWKEIEPPDNVHCVCLVNADKMMYNMTFLGQVMTWPEVKVMPSWPFEVNLYIIRRVLTS